MPSILPVALSASLLSFGAMFGFFYAWVCSTMWGLDAAAPQVAISAMQAMNASVRNGIFALSFFGTPALAGITALIAWRAGQGKVATMVLASLVLHATSVVITASFHIPLNTALADVPSGLSEAEARRVWAGFSTPWQAWNQVRCATSAAALLFCGAGLMRFQGAYRQRS